MKIIIERSALMAAMSRVSGSAGRNSNIPIINNVLISADASGVVEFTATDLDMEARATVSASVTIAGVVTVNASKLREVAASASPGSEISLDLDESDDPRLVVKSGRSRFKLPVIDAADFPTFPSSDSGVSFYIPAARLVSVLSRVAMSMSSDAVRYNLCGAYLHVDGGKIRAAATNGHHLTYRDGDAVDAVFDGVILPSKFVNEITRALADETPDVRVTVYPGQSVMIEASGFGIRSKVIDGTFPDYNRVIPSPPPNVAVMDSEAVSVALKRAMIAAEDKARTVHLTFDDNVLTLRGTGQAEAVDDVEIEYSGDPITMAFNSSYIASILTGVDGAVEVRMNGPADHTTWRGVADDDGLTVLLPVRRGGA